MSRSKAGWKTLARVSGLVFSSAAVYEVRSWNRHAELAQKDGLGYWERRAKENEERKIASAESSARWKQERREIELAKERIARIFDIVKLEKLADEEGAPSGNIHPPWAELERKLYDVLRNEPGLSFTPLPPNHRRYQRSVPHPVVPEQHKTQGAEGTAPGT